MRDSFGAAKVNSFCFLHWLLLKEAKRHHASEKRPTPKKKKKLSRKVTIEYIKICHVTTLLTDADDLSDSFLSGDEDKGTIRRIDNEINGNWISTPTQTSASLQEARLKAKAKRRLRKNSSRDSGRGDSLSDNGDGVRGGHTAPPTSPKSKLLDRKSRLGKGRGLPKKGMCGQCNRGGSQVVQKWTSFMMMMNNFYRPLI